MRILTTSVLFALAALATVATGQPQPPAPQPPAKKTDKPAPKADPTDALIAAALANDPDVKMAKAKIQLAEAELAKARQAVTLKVVSLKAAVERYKVEVDLTDRQYHLIDAQVMSGKAASADVVPVRLKLETAKAALAAAETELKLLTGGGASTAADTVPDRYTTTWTWLKLHQDAANAESSAAIQAYIAAMNVTRERAAVKGPIPDRIRAALDKPVKLGAKGEVVSLEKALEVFKKDAGWDVAVRPLPSHLPAIMSHGEELPVGAWFQMFEDITYNPAGNDKHQCRFVVREYGLLLAHEKNLPPDAPTLTEFWKQKLEVKETKPDAAPKK